MLLSRAAICAVVGIFFAGAPIAVSLAAPAAATVSATATQSDVPASTDDVTWGG
ncbi:hypothetical protein ACWERV_10470 [Streptomyces sp. NPDC004031]